MLLQKSAADLAPYIRPSGTAHLPLTELLIAEYGMVHRADRNSAPGTGLIRSWDRSLPPVIELLNRLGLGAVEVMIEYKLPGRDGDVDVVLAGQHPLTDDLSYVLVELKQWRRAQVWPDNPVAVDIGDDKLKLHPVRQVQRYCEYLIQHLAPLHGHRDRIAGAALLHNATDGIEQLYELPANAFGSLYGADRMDGFASFLRSRLAAKPGLRAAEVLLRAEQYEAPSSSEAFSRVGEPHPVYALQDEQEMAFRDVYETVRRPSRAKKKVVIIQGGPGSGKTAVAVELLRTLKQEGRHVVHASGSASFTKNLRATAKDSAPRGQKSRAERQARQDFRFFQTFGDSPESSIEVLICDEAHRIRTVSDGQYVPRSVKERGWPQADELISAAEVPVFLLDDWQSLRPGEVGTVDYLKERAAAMDCEAVVHQLPGMFRAEGSIEFRDWVTQLLGLARTSPRPWTPDGRFDLRFAETPEELETFLEKRLTDGASARMTAGFCWEWRAPDDGLLRMEVQIGDWHRPWNAHAAVTEEGVPETSQWATDDRGFSQVGCIYTAQNFEFDWNGVIIGPDLVWRGNGFVVDRSKTQDGELKKRSADDADVERCVRNAYHVLLTRARTGTVIYAEDRETRDALRRLISGTIAEQPIRKRKRRSRPTD